MPRKKKNEEQPLERLLELIDEQVEIRGKAELIEADASARIAELVSEARRRGCPMPELTQRVKRMDKKERVLKPVSRQALDTTIAVHEKRRPARTTRASRRRQDDVGGVLDVEALR